MTKFLITYEGAMEMPSTPEAREQMMSAFGAWVGEVGTHMVDPGAPLGASGGVTPMHLPVRPKSHRSVRQGTDAPGGKLARLAL